MKNAIKFACLFLMFMCVILVSVDMFGVQDRKQELEESVSLSMRNTLKASNVNKLYDVSDEEMSAEFIRNLADNINTDSALDIYINELSLDGIIDTKVRATFTHVNGQQGTREVRKTLILEDYEK